METAVLVRRGHHSQCSSCAAGFVNVPRITFDRLASVFLSGANHEGDQPVHLRVADEQEQKHLEHDVFGGPSTRYCPAGVYEWVGEADTLKLVINAQNCVHCKTCDIKDPGGNITWTAPEGGGGPNYPNM